MTTMHNNHLNHFFVWILKLFTIGDALPRRRTPDGESFSTAVFDCFLSTCTIEYFALVRYGAPRSSPAKIATAIFAAVKKCANHGLARGDVVGTWPYVGTTSILRTTSSTTDSGFHCMILTIITTAISPVINAITTIVTAASVATVITTTIILALLAHRHSSTAHTPIMTTPIVLTSPSLPPNSHKH